MNTKFLWIFTVIFAISVVSCNKDDDNNQEPAPSIVDPKDADALSGALVINDATQITGTLPAPDQGNPNQPTVQSNQPSALITAGNTLFLPFTYETMGNKVQNLAGVYLHVDGANTYFKVNLTGQENGIMVIPIQVPSIVDTGEFSLSYAIYDHNGLVSNYLQTIVRIDTNASCPTYATGNDGLTIKSVELGETPGTVTISYDTYSVPDRVDVFYDGVWQAGTGDPLAVGEVPPASRCYDGTNGYVGERGTFEFEYDGTGSGRLDVYMSGCLGGGTAWTLDISCPE